MFANKVQNDMLKINQLLFRNLVFIVVGGGVSLICHFVLQFIVGDGPSEIKYSQTFQYYYVKVFLLYLSTVVGIVANEILKHLRENNQSKTEAVNLTDVFQSVSFLRAILISPIVFYSVYGITSNQPDNIVSILLAFQNGYFWQSIVAKRIPASSLQ